MNERSALVIDHLGENVFHVFLSYITQPCSRGSHAGRPSRTGTRSPRQRREAPVRGSWLYCAHTLSQSKEKSSGSCAPKYTCGHFPRRACAHGLQQFTKRHKLMNAIHAVTSAGLESTQEGSTPRGKRFCQLHRGQRGRRPRTWGSTPPTPPLPHRELEQTSAP